MSSKPCFAGLPECGSGVDEPLVLAVRRKREIHLGRDLRVRDLRTGDDAADRQAELPGEGEVALVVRGDGHDRARAVAGQNVVRDLDRDPLAVDRVDRE